MCLLIFLACELLPSTARAQANTQANPQPNASVPAKDLSALQWWLVGPYRGGRDVAVAGVPGDPRTYYVGAVGGGLWKSTDGGVVYKPIFDAEDVASIGAIAVAPSDPNILYVGTGEADMRSDITFGDGVYKSTDAGKTWTNIGLKDTQQIGRIWIDPKNPDHVLVAALGHAYGPNRQRGVFLTEDGGKSWQQALYKNAETGAIDLDGVPGSSSVIYASMWQTHRVPWTIYAPTKGPGSGLYKSIDGGKTWTQITGHGLPDGIWGRSGIAVAPGTDGKRVYVIIDAPKSGLYRSDDSGQTWTLVGTDPRIRQRMWYFSGIAVDPENPDVVYLSNVAIYRSTDGGKNFISYKGAPGGDDYHFLWIDPTNANRMISGSDQGATISIDGGHSWSSWYNQPTGQFYHVSVDNHFPYRIYGPQQDSGSIAINSRGANGEVTTRDWCGAGGDESGYMLPDPHDDNIVYSSGTGGGVNKFDWRTRQVQDISPTPHIEVATNISKEPYRYPWTPPLAISPLPPYTLYAAAQMVMETSDGGKSWQTISGDLTGSTQTSSQSDDASNEAANAPATIQNTVALGYGVINTIAPSPIQSGLIWVGSDTGLIHLTRDNGKTWSNVTPKGLQPWSLIGIIEASHFDAGTAYATVDRHILDDYRPYMYRTRDYGQTWQLIVNGLSAPAYVNVVREDTERKGLLFAGTELGVDVSFDDGDHWQSLQQNLPPASVRDLAIHGADLIAGTHGRAFWVLTDFSPLRQMSPGAENANAALFASPVAYRVRRVPFEGTPFPPEIPKSYNPPDGATISYLLRDKPAQPIQLTILDAHGNVVRQYSSLPLPPLPRNKADFPDYWLKPPQHLTTDAGLNRIVWDLRYDGAPGSGNPFSTGGPMAVPGQYTVRLTVDGTSYTQPLTVKLDPRAPVSQAALEQQLAFGLKVRSASTQAHQALAQINEVEAKLSRSPKNASSAQAKRLQKKLDALARSNGEESPNSLSAVAEDLQDIGSSAESADAAPTVMLQNRYAKTDAELNRLLEQWKQIQSTDLRQLNAALRREGMPILTFHPHATQRDALQYQIYAGKMEND
ncbi:MAG TPA: hypothetical protein VHX63_10360 [Acidobacteriaceae bacterium]|nr:hypothetical protein [Acidobacteriaceae bacterium]